MELEYSDLAKQDLASIEEYTRENWGRNQADLYLAQIVKILGVPHASMDIERHLVHGEED